MVDQLCQVSQRSCQPVDLSNNNLIYVIIIYSLHQPLQSRAVKMTARDTAIIIVIRQQFPALVLLARMYASQASRWVSSELKSCTSLSSELFRV